MSDLPSASGVEGWIKKADRKLKTLEGAIMRARVPRQILSAFRPDPGKFQPGVLLFETDTNTVLAVNADQDGFLVVNGGTAGGASYTDEQAQDATAALFAAGSHTGISFAYDDAGNRISATVTATGSGGAQPVTGGTSFSPYTPEAYGAKGDGNTDDGPAFNAAIQAASNVLSGFGGPTKVVCTSGRNYRIKTPIVFKPNVHLMLNGSLLRGPITGFSNIDSNNNPSVPAANDVTGQLAGAAITDSEGSQGVLYGAKISDGWLVDFRFGIATACGSWAYPVFENLTFYNCNIGVFTYQGAQQIRMLNCRSAGQIAGTSFVGSATAFPSGHPYATGNNDNYFTDQFLYDGGFSSDRDLAVTNPTFDAWFRNAIMRPTVPSISAQHSGGWVYPFAASDDACQVSGRHIYIPQRNGRVTFHPQLRTCHSQDSNRGVMLVANPVNLDVADVGGEGMFPTTPHAMITILSTNGVNPSGTLRNVDGFFITPGTSSWAVETRNGSEGGVDQNNTKMLVGMNLTSNNGQSSPVNHPGQWTLLP